jgi:hypothetical protein
MHWHMHMDNSFETRAARTHARTVIAERLQNFSLTMLRLRASDVKDLYGWIASNEFSATCELAELDPVAVEAKFTELVDRGNAYNVNFAM